MKSKYFTIDKDRFIFRNHPLFIFKGVLVIIMFPLYFCIAILREIFKDLDIVQNYGKARNIFSHMFEIASDSRYFTYVILGVVGILVFVIVMTIRYYLIWKNTTISLTDKEIAYNKYGIFFKEEKTSFIKDITNVNLQSGIFMNIVGIKRISIDINSSVTAKEEYSIIIKSDIANIFKDIIHRLQSGESIENLLHEFENTEVKKGLSTVKTVLNLEDDMNINDEILHKKVFSKDECIRHVIINFVFSISMWGTIIPLILILEFKKPFLFVILFINLIDLVKNVMKQISKSYMFTIVRTPMHLNISYGLTNKETFVLPIKNIISIGTKQNFIAKLLGYEALTLECIGYGNSNDEVNLLSLYIKKRNVESYLERFVPEFDIGNRTVVDANRENNSNGDAMLEKTDSISKLESDSISKSKSDSISELKSGNETGIKGTSVIKSHSVPTRLLSYLFIKNLIYCMIPTILIYVIYPKFLILLVGLIIVLYATYIGLKNTQITILSDRIIVRKGVFSKSTSIVPYSKMDYVSINQTVISKKLGVNDFEFAIKDNKLGKRIETIKYFEEGLFDNIYEYYQNGEV